MVEQIKFLWSILFKYTAHNFGKCPFVKKFINIFEVFAVHSCEQYRNIMALLFKLLIYWKRDHPFCKFEYIGLWYNVADTISSELSGIRNIIPWPFVEICRNLNVWAAYVRYCEGDATFLVKIGVSLMVAYLGKRFVLVKSKISSLCTMPL